MYQYMIHSELSDWVGVQSAPILSHVILSVRHALILITQRLARPRLSDTSRVSLIIYRAKDRGSGI